MKRILVTGAGGSAGYNFIKSLQTAPDEFYIVGTDSSPQYIHLSPANINYVVPPSNSPRYIKKLNQIIRDEKIEFVHAQPDPEVRVISDNREKIKAKVFLPDKYEIRCCHDKLSFMAHLFRLQIPSPKTYCVADADDVVGLFKGGKKWLRARRGAGSLAALPVDSWDLAREWMGYWRKKGLKINDFIVSEFLPGAEYAFQSVWYKGELIVSAARQRLEYLFQSRMPSGQSSSPTIALSVHNDKVNMVATKGIKSLNEKPHGIYCVDMKCDEKGQPKITEINIGRFFTTSLFFTELGCNMPYIYTRLAYGQPIRKCPYNAVEKDWYWIRQIDIGYRAVAKDA